MTVQDIINHLESLEAKATKGPWKKDTALDGFVWTGGGFDSVIIDTDNCNDDAALIVAMRNAIKPLIAALRFEMETSDTIIECAFLAEQRSYFDRRRAELNAILSDVEMNEETK